MNVPQPRLGPAEAAGLAAAPGQVGPIRPQAPGPCAHCHSSAPRQVPWNEPRASTVPQRLVVLSGWAGWVLLLSHPALGTGLLCPRSYGWPGVPVGRQQTVSSEGRREALGGCPCYQTGTFICDLINQG